MRNANVIRTNLVTIPCAAADRIASFWRAKHPVVFQDPFCVANYPIRFFSAEKFFFAAANGKAEVFPS